MRLRKNGFYCFSPPVMMATFVVEIGLLVYTVVRYKMTPVARVVSALLLFLAVFQLAEYNVCGNSGVSPQAWSRTGFAAITLLPVLGLHLAMLITKNVQGKLVITAYITAAIWIVLFGMSNWAFSEQICGGNYIIFRLRPTLAFYYAVYYYGWILLTIIFCVRQARSANRRIRSALSWQVAGYLLFLVPTAFLGSTRPETTAGIPSIMCGFAVLFALVLAFRILPLTAKRQR